MTTMHRVAAAAMLVMLPACAPSHGAGTPDSATTVPVNSVAVAPDTTPVPSVGAEPREGGSIPPAGPASSARSGAHVTGGPQRAPEPPRSSGCGGTFVNVTMKASALRAPEDMKATTAELQAISTRLLAPVQPLVGAIAISPAVRAFRLSVTRPADAQRVVTQLRSSDKVESVELDDCAVRILPSS